MKTLKNLRLDNMKKVIFKRQIVLILLCILSLFMVSALCSCNFEKDIPNGISNFVDYVKKNNVEKPTSQASSFTISNNRADYSQLSDNEFANFRTLNTIGIAPNKIFRGSSFANENTRSSYIKSAIDTYKINNIIDLDKIEISPDLSLPESKTAFCQICRNIINSNGPVFICCSNGSDKTGIICAMLECLKASGIASLEDDYIKSYSNLCLDFTTNPNIAECAKNQLRKELSCSLGITKQNVSDLNLNKYIKIYLQDAGMNADEITKLIEWISK